jgi:hypothetical protein
MCFMHCRVVSWVPNAFLKIPCVSARIYSKVTEKKMKLFLNTEEMNALFGGLRRPLLNMEAKGSLRDVVYLG